MLSVSLKIRSILGSLIVAFFGGGPPEGGSIYPLRPPRRCLYGVTCSKIFRGVGQPKFQVSGRGLTPPRTPYSTSMSKPHAQNIVQIKNTHFVLIFIKHCQNNYFCCRLSTLIEILCFYFLRAKVWNTQWRTLHWRLVSSPNRWTCIKGYGFVQMGHDLEQCWTIWYGSKWSLATS